MRYVKPFSAFISVALTLGKEQRQEIKEARRAGMCSRIFGSPGAEEAFDIFDSERTGKMDYHELKAARRLHAPQWDPTTGHLEVAVRAMGFEIKKPEALELMQRCSSLHTARVALELLLCCRRFHLQKTRSLPLSEV